jgi:hypothetical protein
MATKPKKTTSKSSTKSAVVYQNNPLLIAINGIKELFQKAQVIAVILAVIAGLSAGGVMLNSPPDFIDAFNGREGGVQTEQQNTDSEPTVAIDTKSDEFEKDVKLHTPEVLAVTGFVAVILSIFLVVAVLISTYVNAMIDYTIARVSRGKFVTFPEAFKQAAHSFFPYLWLQIIVGVKTFLWSLLLIVPGYIMSVRYAFAGVSFFDRGLRGNNAVKNSLELTRNAWLTTNASFVLPSIVTMGTVDALINPGARVTLYRQLDSTAVDKRPKAHALSWVALALQIALIVLLFVGVAIVVGLVIYALNHK